MVLEALKLHNAPAGPSAWKVAIVLEELQIPYVNEVVPYGDLKKQPFTDINPNGRSPALHDPNTGYNLWESNAIIEYLIQQYDKDQKLTYASAPETFQLKQWSYFQASGQGPYYGQAAWFIHFHPEKLPSVQKRYLNEMKRVVSVLDSHLGRAKNPEHPYLVGDKCTYADLTFVMWNRGVDTFLSVDPEMQWNSDDFPHFKKVA